MPTVVDNANVASRPKRSSSHKEIADLAHQLWHERGEGDGHADEDWTRAAKQLVDR
jgi:hypothetical protein